MISMYCWQTLSKHFAIKVALPHLLLGVMATALSLSEQNLLSARVQETNIITITSVMETLGEHQADVDIPSPLPCAIENRHIAVTPTLSFPPQYNKSMAVVRLTPNNGIRAGPISLMV